MATLGSATPAASPASLRRAIKHQDRIEVAVPALVSLPIDVIEATEMG